MRRVLLTGAASGLARGVAIDLARHGYRIAFTYRPGGTSPEATRAAVREASVDGAFPPAIAADHAIAGETGRAVREAEAALGGIEALVHMVGPIVVRPFASSSIDDLEAMIAGNLRSAVEAAAAVLPGMRKAGFGRLVYFGMNGSHETIPAKNLSLYGAAKAGVVAFARTLALEEAVHGVTVNVIEPGDIRSKDADRQGARLIEANNPTGHAGSWQDIAYGVRFLVADEASFINGMSLGINGGLTAPHE